MTERNGTGIEHIRAILQRFSLGQEAPRRAWADFYEEWQCDHPVTELRVKTNAAGAKMYGKQCLRCGSSNTAPRNLAGGRGSSWIKRSSIENPDAIPLWDETLPEQFAEERETARRDVDTTFALAQEERAREWWTAYNQYLQTAHWQRIRRKVLERANYQCEGCGEARATQVHHTSYKHIGDELLFELRAVCQACHDKIHPDKKGEHAA